MVTTKDLREMCQNGVTLDDIRRLYGVNATLEDVELVLPALLVDDLGILPYSEVATKSLSESQIESQHMQEQKGSPSQDVGDDNEIEEKVSTSQHIDEGKASTSQDVFEEKASTSQDETEEKVSATEVEKQEKALPLLPSAGQQVASKIEPEAPSLSDPLPSTIPWRPLLALCLFSPTSNMLDVLASLGVLSHLDGSV